MIGGQSVLAIITARGGSKGIPGKNVVPVSGRPLIQWTIDAAKQSRYIDRLILSSDDPVIIEVATSAGCEAPFVRDTSLASDAASSIDVVADALNHVPGFDIAVLLQPTSPLREAADIDSAIEQLHRAGAPACVTVREAEDHPYWTFKMGESGELLRFAAPDSRMITRRQDLPPAWCLNGAVYVTRIEWFLRHRTFLSPETIGCPMPASRSIDIDTYEDLESFKKLVADRAR